MIQIVVIRNHLFTQKKSDNKGYQILDATDPPVRSASIKHREQYRKKIQKTSLYDVKKIHASLRALSYALKLTLV